MGENKKNRISLSDSPSLHCVRHCGLEAAQTVFESLERIVRLERSTPVVPYYWGSDTNALKITNEMLTIRKPQKSTKIEKLKNYFLIIKKKINDRIFTRLVRR